MHRVLDPEMSAAEQQGLQRSADAIKAALSRLSLKDCGGKQLEELAVEDVAGGGKLTCNWRRAISRDTCDFFHPPHDS